MGNIVICMAYIDRLEQLKRTLAAYAKFGHKYSVVIANDGDTPLRREDLPDTGTEIAILDSEGVKDKRWTDPCVSRNKAINHAINEMGADIVVQNNPECMPVMDIVGDAGTLPRGEYRVYSCLSLDEATTQNIGGTDLMALAGSVQKGASKDFDLAWYQHPEHRPAGYEFCAALSAKDMKEINGYDERLAYGVAYSDNYLLHRIRMAGIKVVMPKEPFVVHQYHGKKGNTAERGELVKKNRIIYNQLITTVTKPRAIRLITEDLA